MSKQSPTPLWQSAAAFAARAHQRQHRKDGITPYIAHPVRVALIVACVFGFDDQHILAAALLHDTIEDTTADYDDLQEAFGKRVADIVAALTKDMRLVEAKREVAYDKQLAAASWEARLVKLADVYDNLVDCEDTKSRRKQLAKAKRALALSANDRQLQQARKVVRSLMAG